MAKDYFFHDIAPDCDPLSLSTNDETIVSLSGGGPAILSPPANTFVDGRRMELVIAGIFTISGGSDKTASTALYLGSSATIGSDTQLMNLTSDSYHGSKNFLFVAELIWDSTSGSLRAIPLLAPFSGSPSLNAFSLIPTGLSQGSLQFLVSGQVSVSTSGTLKLTQFSLEAK